VSPTHAALLESVAAADPAHVLLTWQGRDITVAEIAGKARAIAERLHRDGIRPGNAIAVMLDNHPDHVALIFGLALAGAVWVPLNAKLKAPAIRHIASVTEPVGFIAEDAYADAVTEAGIDGLHWQPGDLFSPAPEDGADWQVPAGIGPESTRTILFTSGTTGAPKGVIVTERMLLAASNFAAQASAAMPGDRFHFWEPLIHVGGAQMLALALMRRATLVMVPRFSASRFWEEVRAGRINKAHYLGGVLDILLKQPDDGRGRDHGLELAFGAGARPEVWTAFEERFGVRLVEVYGMTEASSFSTINHDHVIGSIGKAAPGVRVELLDPDGQPVAEGERGEIVVTTEPPELMTPGYLGNPEATAELRRGTRLHTGDIAWRDAEGNYFFSGRSKDMIRHKGENVSAWEVERVLNDHPEVAETAVIGVPGELGEEDILACILPVAGANPDAAAIIGWCADRLAAFQLPRYVRFVTDFDRTPSERIRKGNLDRNPSDAIDLAAKRG
jgi:crotonobetaine/carnitine-CoA ligase